MNSKTKTIRALAEAGVVFCVNIPTPSGGVHETLSPNEAELYLSDREQIHARLLGLTVQEYREWLSMEGEIRCSAINSNGFRCKNLLSGGMRTDAKQWKRDQGGYCAIHGGKGSRNK